VGGLGVGVAVGGIDVAVAAATSGTEVVVGGSGWEPQLTKRNAINTEPITVESKFRWFICSLLCDMCHHFGTIGFTQ
jgi:hypothetical protein